MLDIVTCIAFQENRFLFSVYAAIMSGRRRLSGQLLKKKKKRYVCAF